VAGAAKRRKRRFELSHLGTENELAVAQHTGNCRINTIAKPLALGCDVNERNRGRVETSVLVHALELIFTVGKARAASPGRAEVGMGALHPHSG
jgi:hypothetical protein